MGGHDTSDVRVRRAFNPIEERPTTVIVEALAGIKNTEPRNLDKTLHNAINADALNTLISPEREVTVSFTLDRYFIIVSADEVTITLA